MPSILMGKARRHRLGLGGKIYPEAQVEWYVLMVRVLHITPEIRVAYSEFELSYARSSGPGGQNVNKVNSKAVLRWNVRGSSSLSSEVKDRLIVRLGNQLTAEGDLVISSDRFRDQLRNREDCFEKLVKMLAAAAHRPKSRRKTKPSRSSQRRLKEAKARHSEKKNLRRSRLKDY